MNGVWKTGEGTSRCGGCICQCDRNVRMCVCVDWIHLACDRDFIITVIIILYERRRTS
jgi:hypothetical protein